MRRLLYLFLVFNVACFAADLPKNGIDPPPVVMDPPGGLPGDPGTGVPIGSGLLVIGGLSILYVLKRKKEV